VGEVVPQEFVVIGRLFTRAFPMIREQPKWSFSIFSDTATLLLKNRVVGASFCLDRTDGQCLWQYSSCQATHPVGESDGIIVSTSQTRGCFGIDLNSGKLLWTSHGNGFWGVLLRICDFIPGYANEFSDIPIHVKDGRVITESGRILDVQTGKQIEKMSREKAKSYNDYFTSPEFQLFSERKFLLEDGTWLTHMLPDKGQQVQDMLAPRSALCNDFLENGFQFYRLDQSGDLIWSFQPKTGYYSFGVYNLALPDYAYMICSEDDLSIYDHETHKYKYDLSKFHFITISLKTGRIIQNFLIKKTPLARCDIYDVDVHGVLIRCAETGYRHKNQLPAIFKYYERI